MDNQVWQYDADKHNETVTCPYCEQQITGDALYLMNHGIVCRQQWEAKQEQVKNQSK